MEMKMSTSIMIHREYDHDAIAAECPYFVEVTEGQAFAFAKLVERANKGVFVSADEGYDAFVESFGLSLLTDQIDEIKAIFTNPEVDTLLDQILRLDIRISCTEAIGLGIRSEEHTSELQSLMRISYAVFCLT